MGTIIDVYKLISSLMDEARKAKNDNMISQLIDIKMIMLDIQTENQNLKKQLEQQKQIERHSDGEYVTLKDDDKAIQYCSTCWGNEGKLIQLMDASDERSKYTRCPICHDNWLKSRNGR